MQTKTDILTPALLLNLDAFEANLARMITQVTKSGKKLRPHAKAHKCPEIARRQIDAGAAGICVATLAEAEMMALSGIAGMLLTSPLAQPQKIARLAAISKDALSKDHARDHAGDDARDDGRLIVVVDHMKQAQMYQEAAQAIDAHIDMLVDLDVGDHRTGAASLEQAVQIAEAIDRASHLRLRGLQAYSVVGSHAAPGEERTRISREVFAKAAAVRDAMQRKGLSTEILSGGSTGTWQVDTELPELTELQAGSFVLMDLAYARAGLDFKHALSVLATVVSANHESFVTVDAGYKSFSTDRGYGPEAMHIQGTQYRWGGDEFGYVDFQSEKLYLGDRVEFIPPHCDPTVNLYDTIYACRKDRVEGVWPVKRAVSPR